MPNKVMVSYGNDCPGVLWRTVRAVCTRDKSTKKVPANIRAACSRSLCGIGFTMLYLEDGQEEFFRDLEKRIGPDLQEKLQADAQLLSMKARGVPQVPRQVWVREANTRRSARPELEHCTLSLLHRDLDQHAFKRVCDTLAEQGIEIVQNDTMVRTWGRAKNLRCWKKFRALPTLKWDVELPVVDHWFRCYQERGSESIKSVRKALKPILGKENSDFLFHGHANPERALTPGDYPSVPIRYTSRGGFTDDDPKSYVYLMLVCQHVPDLLGSCAQRLMAIDALSRPRMNPKQIEIARSTFRSMGGWVCMTMCLALPEEVIQTYEDNGVLDSLQTVVNYSIVQRCQDSGIVFTKDKDVVPLCKVRAGGAPWSETIQPAAGEVMAFQEDAPGLLLDLVNGAYGKDYEPGDHGYWVVQYDQWSHGAGRAPRWRWQSKHVFGLLGHDSYILTKWMNRAVIAARKQRGEEVDDTRWLAGTAAWRSSKQQVHHDTWRCDSGMAIPLTDYRRGDGGKALCQECETKNAEEAKKAKEAKEAKEART